MLNVNKKRVIANPEETYHENGRAAVKGTVQYVSVKYFELENSAK